MMRPADRRITPLAADCGRRVKGRDELEVVIELWGTQDAVWSRVRGGDTAWPSEEEDRDIRVDGLVISSPILPSLDILNMTGLLR